MDLEYLLYRIIDGYYTISIENILYKIKCPSVSIKHEAHLVYSSIIDNNKYDIDSWISSKMIEKLQSIYGIWTPSHQKELDLLDEDIQKYKIDLYLNYQNESKKKFIKKQIASSVQSYHTMLSQKNCFDYLTLEYYAQNVKNQFLILHMIYDKNDNKIFQQVTNLDDVDISFINQLTEEINNNTINMEDIKKLARNDLWKSMWNVSKVDAFGVSAKDFTDEQRSLVSFSKILDSIREHPESPSNDIINDDDALDGWILYQNDKYEKEKKKQNIDNKYGLSKKNGNEIFIVTNDEAEKRSIYELNDTQTNKDIQQMIKLGNDKEYVNWIDLPHVKRDLQTHYSKARN